MDQQARIAIGTLAAGGVVETEYLKSIFSLTQAFAKSRPSVSFDLATISISDLQAARNTLVHHFLNDKSFTHLLFIDADMGFRPNLIARMLDFRRPFVGAVCPQRSLKLEAYAAICGTGEGQALLRESLALDYVTAESALTEQNAETGRTYLPLEDGGFIRLKEIGTGILLVERSVFLAVQSAFPDLLLRDYRKYSGLGINAPVWQFFAAFRDESGEFLGEDISFCRRWSHTGGEIWGCVSEEIRHVGKRVHTGRYLDRLERGMFQN